LIKNKRGDIIYGKEANLAMVIGDYDGIVLVKLAFTKASFSLILPMLV
jgi:hypothetical protein